VLGLADTSTGLWRLLHDQRSDHPEHPVGALGVGQDMAVEGPGSGLTRLDQNVVALPAPPSLCRPYMDALGRDRPSR
jgi:hypothetical protein